VAEPRLEELRKRIDEIDRELLRLLNERMKVSIEVVKAKRPMGKAVFDPPREVALLEKLSALNPGPLSNEGLVSIYKEILAESRIRQALSSEHKDSAA
jgi:chorismate mutase/prephenate dehydratase